MIIENLVTNPGVESDSGSVTVRQNLFTNPAAGVDATGWAANYGTGGAGTLTRVTGVTGPTGTGITTAAQQEWTTAPTGGTPYVALGNPLTSAAVVVGDKTYHAGVFVRRIMSVSVSYLARMYWFDSAGASISFVDSAAVLINPASTWVEIRVSGVAPANAVKAQLYAVTATAPFVVGDKMQFTGYICSDAPGYFDGGTPAVGDFTYSWTGTAGASISTETAPSPTSLTGGANAGRVQSSAWAAGGSKSLRIIPTRGSSATFGGFAATGLTVGATYTAVGTIRLAAAQTGTLSSEARGITTDGPTTTYLAGFEKPANTVGVAEVRVTFVATSASTQLRYMNGASSGGGDVWWDNLALIAGVFTDPQFDGSTTSTDTITYTWTGPADASTSRQVTYLVGTNLTIGRFGIDITVDSVAQWDEQGNRVTVSGQTHHGSVPDALTLRQQLMGYVDSPDETFVPVTWADQPSVNGFYRVVSARVDPHKDGAFAGVFLFSVELERVQGFTAPLVECVSVGKLRTSGLTLTPRPFQGIPAGGRSFNEYHPDTRTSQARAVDVRRAGENSVVNIFARGTTATDDYVVGQFYIPPVKFYEGASTLLLGGKVVTGRQIQNDADGWLLSNDLFQARPVAGAATTIEFRAWAGGAWSAWSQGTFQSGQLEPGVGDPLPFPHTVTVLANSPEAVTIRLLTTVSYAPVTIDITLRRGARYLSVELAAGFYQYYSIKLPDMVSPTALTGGFSKALTGVTLVAGSPTGTGPTMVAATTSMYPGGGVAPQYWDKTFSFGVGLTTEAAQTLLNEYFWAGSEKQTVVAR